MNQSSIIYLGDNGNSVTIFEEIHGGGGDLRFRFDTENSEIDCITFEFTVSGQRSYHTMCAIRNILARENPERESIENIQVTRISDENGRKLMLDIGEDGVSLTGIDPIENRKIYVNAGAHTLLKQTFSMVARAMMKDNKENPLTDISTEQEASVYS